MFDKFSADGLVDQVLGGRAMDRFWPVQESMKQVRARAREVSKSVFVDENKDKKCKIRRLFPSSFLFMTQYCRLDHSTVDLWQLSCVSLDGGRMRFLTDVRHLVSSLRCAHSSFVSRLADGYPVYQEIMAGLLLQCFLVTLGPGPISSRFVTLL
jgi:hypothetical protein